MGIYRRSSAFAFGVAAAAAAVACSSSSSSAPKCCSTSGTTGVAVCQCPDADAGYGVSTTNGVCAVTLTDAVHETTVVAPGGHLVASCPADAGL